MIPRGTLIIVMINIIIIMGMRLNIYLESADFIKQDGNRYIKVGVCFTKKTLKGQVNVRNEGRADQRRLKVQQSFSGVGLSIYRRWLLTVRGKLYRIYDHAIWNQWAKSRQKFRPGNRGFLDLLGPGYLFIDIIDLLFSHPLI